jgi:hypothetical protein
MPNFPEGFTLQLVPAELLAAKEAELDARRQLLPEQYDLALLDAPPAGRALKFYLLLTEMPDLLAGHDFSPEQLFWSRYYWFLQYVYLRQADPDAGLEQQAMQILEHPHPTCTPDWSVLQGVEAAARQGNRP